MIIDKRQWKKVFYHDLSTGIYFNDNEYYYANAPNKLNLLGNVTEKDKINGYFEFALEYEEYSMLFYWKQTKNIVETTASDTSTDLGYVGSIGKYFGGMAKSDTSFCLYDALLPSIRSNNWWFALGAKTYWNSENKFPGPIFWYTDDQYVAVSKVALYIKKRRSNLCISKQMCRNSKYIANFLLVIIFSL